MSGDTVSGVVTIVTDRGTPVNQRMLVVTASNLAQGQVLDITSSLNKAATSVNITPSSAGFSVRLNCLRYNAPARGDVAGQANDLLFTSQMPNLAFINQYKDTTLPVITIPSGQTFTINGSPTESIELVTCSGAFTIIVQ